jgi:hypothetical protein
LRSRRSADSVRPQHLHRLGAGGGQRIAELILTGQLAAQSARSARE